MGSLAGVLLFVVPALVAVAAGYGAVVCAQQIAGATWPLRIIFGILTLVLAGVALGIGSCYAMLFSGNFRIAG
jgi:hypothetical protein